MGQRGALWRPPFFSAYQGLWVARLGTEKLKPIAFGVVAWGWAGAVASWTCAATMGWGAG
jgi:hypothetical protein